MIPHNPNKLVKELRLAKNMTIVELAAKLKISRVWLSYIEHEKKPIGFKLAENLKKVLGMPFYLSLSREDLERYHAGIRAKTLKKYRKDKRRGEKKIAPELLRLKKIYRPGTPTRILINAMRGEFNVRHKNRRVN